MKSLKLLFCVLLASTSMFAQNLSVPLGGNAYSSNAFSGSVADEGIVNWGDPAAHFTAYIRVSKPGSLIISIDEKPIIYGKSVVEFSINNRSKNIVFDEAENFDGKVGEWNIIDTGYVAISIKGISKTKNNFPSIKALNISGSVTDGKTAYVKNNEGNFFHWGRRGPSVHLNYMQPKNVNASWCYNEVTVPVGEDVLGSYFMAVGFGEGYFGMQVNGPEERHILFSVWSPFSTDDPKSIPESQKIKMLSKGKNVHTGEFGNEGSGGQSYLNYMWKAGNTYKFLLHAEPSLNKDSTTTYTAYFLAPELGKWQIVASFKRPKTHTYLTGFHSFLENFSPPQGDKTRSVSFNNQWVCDANSNWTEIGKARFTTDETGSKGYRMDYAGGERNGAFYLENCGFFNNYTKPGTIFERKLTGKAPAVDFKKLPK
ncbi:DUF3472 domain-containing protein [Pedobacter changchengzhani]|uniref:DUF3472 domain-containing protein n=1 Tax=Pedobacter changchengzhani TaxID=2529274 RepID=A0A4R5MN84_9SPHI|nr:DUF3472 domain-containing protein [Pedobacter changchengzhani]TDG37202.1 DUF3472 domain-containing protein [Pedobacter changchengzhani]